MQVKADVKIDSSTLVMIERLAEVDDELKLFANSRLRAWCEPYVPMRDGMLMSNVEVTPDYVAYNSPYAHYMYEGIVYAPNIPIKDKDGNIIRWISPPVKHATDRSISYSTDLHPLACAHWDKVAMSAHLQDLTDELQAFIDARNEGLNG